MRNKRLLTAILLGVVLCFVSGVGYGEISGDIKEGYVDYASHNQVRFLKARVDYIMRNPNNFLDVEFIYDLSGILGSLIFDELPPEIDTKGKILIKVNDNRNAFSYTTGSPRKLDCFENFPLPEDAEVRVEDKSGLWFRTTVLGELEEVFAFYAPWLRAESWRLLPRIEKDWSFVCQTWCKGETTLVVSGGWDSEGRTIVNVLAKIRPRVLLDEFKRELETIYESISTVASDMNTDIVVRFTRGVTLLGYFYQGEYHLWEE